MKKNNILLKIIILGFGLMFIALGVALSVKANLGLSPISCIPYVFSFKISLSLGTLTILFNLLFMIIQVGILRRNFRLIQLLQLPVLFVLGIFIDLFLNLVSDLNVSNYFWQVLWCLISCIVIGFGVFLEVKAKLTYLAAEGLALAIADTLKKEFGKVKMTMDSLIVLIGLISSFVLFHQLQGIREGTIIAAILIGLIAKFFNKKIHIIDFWFEKNKDNNQIVNVTQNNSKNNLAITISQEYGSADHAIEKRLAEKLYLSFYDKKLIELTTKQSRFSSDYIHQNEQKLAHSPLSKLYEQNHTYLYEKQPLLDIFLLTQSKIIRNVFANNSNIIVKRCANFILKDNPNCFNIFIHTKQNYCEVKISNEYKIESEITDSKLTKIDNKQANYCLNHTDENWNNAESYHITLDSSKYNYDTVVEIITNSIKKNIENLNKLSRKKAIALFYNINKHKLARKNEPQYTQTSKYYKP